MVRVFFQTCSVSKTATCSQPDLACEVDFMVNIYAKRLRYRCAETCGDLQAIQPNGIEKGERMVRLAFLTVACEGFFGRVAMLSHKRFRITGSPVYADL